jgi:hypothetical protein
MRPQDKCAVPYPASTDLHHPGCCEMTVDSLKRSLFFVNRKVVFHPAATFMENRSHRMLAVEIEVSALAALVVGDGARVSAISKNAQLWGQTVCLDASLPAGGFEINSSPANGDAFIQQMKDTQQVLTLAGAQANERCGMHVHVDARDFRYAHLANLIQIYCKIEIALYAMLPMRRRMGKYSVPCRDTIAPLLTAANETVKAVKDIELVRLLKNMGVSQIGKKEPKVAHKPQIAMTVANRLYGKASSFGSGSVKRPPVQGGDTIRYWGLNLHSWFLRKTIEFRMWPGSVSLHEMMMWPQILAAILDAAYHWTPTQIDSLPDDPLMALKAIVEPSTSGLPMFPVRPKLKNFVQEYVGRNSPFYANDVQLYRLLGMNAVMPFHNVLSSGRTLGWSLEDHAFTYAKILDYRWSSPRDYSPIVRFATSLDIRKGPFAKFMAMQTVTPSLSGVILPLEYREEEIEPIVPTVTRLGGYRRTFAGPNATLPPDLTYANPIAPINPLIDVVEVDRLTGRMTRRIATVDLTPMPANPLANVTFEDYRDEDEDDRDDE